VLRGKHARRVAGSPLPSAWWENMRGMVLARCLETERPACDALGTSGMGRVRRQTVRERWFLAKPSVTSGASPSRGRTHGLAVQEKVTCQCHAPSAQLVSAPTDTALEARAGKSFVFPEKVLARRSFLSAACGLLAACCEVGCARSRSHVTRSSAYTTVVIE
jgi:hypothetical protein